MPKFRKSGRIFSLQSLPSLVAEPASSASLDPYPYHRAAATRGGLRPAFDNDWTSYLSPKSLPKSENELELGVGSLVAAIQSAPLVVPRGSEYGPALDHQARCPSFGTPSLVRSV